MLASARKCLDQGGGFRRPRHDEQVPVIDHPELGVGNQPRQNAAVDRRDQSDRRHPSARASAVAATTATAGWSSRSSREADTDSPRLRAPCIAAACAIDQGWVFAKGSAVDFRQQSCSCSPCRCSAAASPFSTTPQGWPGTIMAPGEVAASTSRRHSFRILMRELLRDAAAPGDTGDVDLAVSELCNETGGKPRQRRWAIRKERHGRAADAGHIKDDCRRTRECFKERLRQLPVRANSVEQQQRRPRRRHA